MQTLTLDLPVLYGDHHVTEVRQLLGAIDGVTDIYASSCFQLVELSFDPAKTSVEAISATLEEAGYLQDLAFPTETGAAVTSSEESSSYFRHTAFEAPTGMTVGFVQEVASAGRPLWPCPGVGAIRTMDEGD